jgi:hypothetical protein
LLAALDAPTPGADRFATMVANQLGGANYYEFSPRDAALLYALTGNAAYGEYAVELVEARVVAEEALTSTGQRATVAGDSYLEVGPLIGDLALTYDWCFALLTQPQRDRWVAYANQAVWNVWHPDDAVWGGVAYPWSGWSVDNPSNNYYYSFLRATMLLGLATDGENPQATTWLDTFRQNKIAAQLVPTFNADLVGGGSREGTGYGVAMKNLFELYDFWGASTGERLADLTAHTRASLLWMLHATVPTLDRIAPTGDHARDSTAALFDYHRAYVQELATLYAGDTVAAAARTWTDDCSVPQMTQAFMFYNDFLYADPAVPRQPLTRLHPVYFGSGTGQLFARSAWDSAATWVNLIAGPYSESHAHHDQGALMLFKREWLLDDQNKRSSSGIRQEEELHNLVRLVEGSATIRQREGAPRAQLLALHHESAYTYAAAEVTPIYDDHASVGLVQRELVLLWPDVVVVFDRVTTAAGVELVWQLNTAIMPQGSGMTRTFAGTETTMTLHRLLPLEGDSTLTLFDWSTDSEMSDGFRLDITATSSGATQAFLNVLSLDAAVSSVAASDTGTARGVVISLADGGTATLRFELASPGGTITLVPASGPSIDATLPLTVEPQAELAP